MDDGIVSEVDRIIPEIVALRHEIHRNPELSMKEFQTSDRVRNLLADTTIDLLPPYLETDVIGMLEGGNAGKNITLRADMDALPLDEKTGASYQSRNPGVMHACGHDGHTSMLIGAARVLDRFRDRLSGTVRFVFQPGEEIGGGRQLLAKNILSDPPPAEIIALHGSPSHPLGRISARPGIAMAACDFFNIEVRGKGSHAARPEEGIDTVLTASRIVDALQSVVSRSISAFKPGVVSICHIESGMNCNVLPDDAFLEGCIRYLEPEVGETLRTGIDRIIKGTCDAMGATYVFNCDQTFAATVNTPEVVARGARVARDLFGCTGWHELPEPALGSEDFSFFLLEHPGAMFRVGVGEDVPALHNPGYDFTDEALRAGILFFVGMTMDLLS